MATGAESATLKSTRREFLLVAGTSVLATAALASAASDDGTSPTTQAAGGGAAAASAVAIVWKDDIEGGDVELAHAHFASLDGQNAKSPGDFRLQPGVRRLEIHLDETHTELGAFATRVTVHFRGKQAFSDKSLGAFTFFLRDVIPETPILIRKMNVAVVRADDRRTFDQIDAAIRAKRLLSEAQAIDAAGEQTFEDACQHTRVQRCPTWLGVGRDIRIFRVMSVDSFGHWGQIEAVNYAMPSGGPDGKTPVSHSFMLGRGAQCGVQITRRLEDGVLPILHSVQRDGEVEYRLTLFATLEKEPLTADHVRGTHWVAALANTVGAMLTKQEEALYNEKLRASEVLNREQELVCWVRVEVVNTDSVPRYAYLRAPDTSGAWAPKFVEGNRLHGDGKVASINRLNGRPLPQEEMALLIQPQETITLDMLFPHRPLPRERAAALARQSFEAHHQACRAYWRRKLEQGGRISLPEAAVDERVRAGTLLLDIATLGKSKEGPLLATVGWYSPIGSESAPIIQFYDSLGYHDLAERSIQFFLDRQHDDGFIQTFGGYQLETGPLLWTIGEHFRATHDVEWARRIQPKALKACQYILAWRRRNMRAELRGKGYGLIDGRVADPLDYFHSFTLNGLAYLGLKRIVEVYSEIDPRAVAEIKQETAAYLADIRTSYVETVARSPVVPLGDGAWVPSFAPWPEYPGPVSLYAEGGNWLTHGAFPCRDSLIGPLYLGIGEVLDPHEPLAEWLLHAHQELMTYRNAGMSQPYYCRHDWLHMRRGEVKQFLKTYYNQFCALQDRETYTSWEHYFGASQNKTHEEAWFLMQTRWMLWNEDHASETLRLLSMIPRGWLEAGQEIKLEKCVSHYGPFSLVVRASAPLGQVEATVTLHGPAERHPQIIALRLPHPAGKRPSAVQGGQYDAPSESVVIKSPTAETRIVVRYA